MGRINVTAEHIASLKPMEVVKDDLVRQIGRASCRERVCAVV